MARKRSTSLTEGELRIMQALWALGRATVAEVVERLGGPNGPAYNTVLTMLAILERKGHVTRDKSGRAHEYVSLLDRSHAQRSALAHVLDRFFEGSPRLLLLTLLEQERLDPNDLQAVREAIDRTPDPESRKPRERRWKSR